MYMVCWTNAVGQPIWQIVDGEDAMQEFVSDLVNDNIPVDEIFVFPMEEGL